MTFVLPGESAIIENSSDNRETETLEFCCLFSHDLIESLLDNKESYEKLGFFG